MVLIPNVCSAFLTPLMPSKCQQKGGVPFHWVSRGRWKYEDRPLTGVSASCYLHCFDTLGWMTGRASGPSQNSKNKWSKKTEVDLANSGLLVKWPIKWRWTTLDDGLRLVCTTILLLQLQPFYGCLDFVGLPG